MDEFRDADFGILAILVWLLLATRLLQLFLVPSLLLAAAHRFRGVVQQWVYDFSIEQHGSLSIFTSVVYYAASIALAVAIVGLAYTVKRMRSE